MGISLPGILNSCLTLNALVLSAVMGFGTEKLENFTLIFVDSEGVILFTAMLWSQGILYT
jgi:hypothetical protein